MPRPLSTADVSNQRIAGVFRVRLQGDPDDYDGEYGDYFRPFVALENETYFELFDDVSPEYERDLLYDKLEAESLSLKPVDQIMAKNFIGKTIQGVSRRPNGETIVWLTSGQMITVESDYDTVICLCDVEEYRKDCPWFFEDVRPLGESK